jgi:tetratricopeptide (TPR) repeat protein
MKFVRASLIVPALLASIADAEAAVSVIGNGKAHSCYIEAEYTTDPRMSVAICIDALRNEILSKKDRSATLINRAILRAESADTPGAMEDYEAAIAVGANTGEAYSNRAATHIALKQYSEALSDADRAVHLRTPRMEIAYYNRALANEALGNVQAAYADYQAAVRAEPRFAAATEALSRFRVVKSGG